MKKLSYLVPSIAVVAATLLTAQPAMALPTCEQEVRIRCSGHDVNGRPRLDIYYDSYEECVAGEQPLRCGTQPDPYASIYQKPTDVVTRQARAMPA